MEWNLGNGLRNVCQNVMRKLNYAGWQLENRERTIIRQRKWICEKIA